MAIINNNVENVKFLRNQDVNITRDAAISLLNTHKEDAADGTALLARYTVSGEVKTIVGFVYVTGSTHDITIFDTEGASGDVEALRREINAKLGTDFISSGNTVEANLTALSGNGSSTSAETSVEGAKRYADELKNQMDYSGVTTGDGVYVTNVTQSDGIVSATTEVLPSVTDAKEAKKVVVSVSEDKGQISIERGTISSSAETMVLTDNTDGGVNFEVNIDNNTIIQDAQTKKLKVADAALVQYEGDTKTIAISPVQGGVRTVSSIITLSSVTPSSTTVKEEYALKNASGETIGSTIKIYKDSSLVSITYIKDPADTHYQNLEYVYIDASGNTQTEYVDMSSLVLEAEFASGVTFSDGVAHGVVDSTSETFLTVGTNGFKLSGVQNAIDTAVSGAVETLDANVSGNSTHVTVGVGEEDGVITSVTVSEDNIANANDLAGLSAKTVTEVASSNSSISATSSATADGTVKYDIVTDADKIQMSGFSADSASALSGIAGSDSIATAFEKTNAVITENERVTAAALTDLDGRLDVVEDKYISGVSVNGNAVTIANKVAPISIKAATSAVTATSTEAIVVNTDANGNITLGISSIDCGYYSE